MQRGMKYIDSSAPSRSLIEFASEMLSSYKSIHQMAYALALRDFSIQYRQSLIGIGWALLPPIIAAVGVHTAIKSQILSLQTPDMPLAIYIIIGTIVWQVFSEAVNTTVQSFNRMKPIISKMHIPLESLFLSRLYQGLVGIALRIVFIVAVVLWFNYEVSPKLALGLFLMIPLSVFGSVIGLMLAPFGLMLQDIVRGLQVFFAGLFFITPVVYVPAKSGFLGVIHQYNPIFWFIDTIRHFSVDQPSVFTGYALAVSYALPFVVLAMIIFARTALPHAIERMG